MKLLMAINQTLYAQQKHAWQKKDKLEYQGIEYIEMMAQKQQGDTDSSNKQH